MREHGYGSGEYRCGMPMFFAIVVALHGVAFLGCDQDRACRVVWKRENESVEWAPRTAFGCVEHKGRLWVIGGSRVGAGQDRYLNDVWTSGDGITWENVTDKAIWGPRAYPCCFSFHDGLWVVGGFLEDAETSGREPIDVWTSKDGAVWEKIEIQGSAPVRSGYMSVVYKDRLWLLDGTKFGRSTGRSKVWSSSDGRQWSVETDKTPWSEMGVLQRECVVHRSGMVVIDSNYSGARVWRSTDGRTWEMLAEDVGWVRRTGFSCVSENGKIWVFGGEAKPDRDFVFMTNEVWCSDDGNTWLHCGGRVPWPERSQAVAVSFHSKLWLYAGATESGFLRDAWSGTPQ
jgi:hypothetical protein